MSDSMKLHEEGFLYVSEFRRRLEDSGLSAKTVNRHVVNVVDFLYFCSTHTDGDKDKAPVDETLIRRGAEYFSAYFVTWIPKISWNEESAVKGTKASLKKWYHFLGDKMDTSAELMDLKFY